MHALSPCSEWTEEALSVQRKVLSLPPLLRFACESILLLSHSEGDGLKYLIQLWRLSEMNVCVKKRTRVQSSRDSTTIVLSLFWFHSK